MALPPPSPKNGPRVSPRHEEGSRIGGKSNASTEGTVSTDVAVASLDDAKQGFLPA